MSDNVGMLDVLLAAVAHLAAPHASAAPPEHRQVVVVRASAAGDTEATVEAYAYRDGAFHRVIGPVHAFVGAEGIGSGSEWHSRTPAGVYPLTQGFGWAANPGTRIPYRKVGSAAWWVSDIHSPAYNTLQFCRPAACTFDTAAAEPLASISVYRHALVIDYNRSPVVSGAGSAFFQHESGGEPTAGCVAIEGDALTRIMRWLRPAAQPVISIGVGARAYRPLA